MQLGRNVKSPPASKLSVEQIQFSFCTFFRSKHYADLIFLHEMCIMQTGRDIQAGRERDSEKALLS